MDLSIVGCIKPSVTFAWEQRESRRIKGVGTRKEVPSMLVLLQPSGM